MKISLFTYILVYSPALLPFLWKRRIVLYFGYLYQIIVNISNDNINL